MPIDYINEADIRAALHRQAGTLTGLRPDFSALMARIHASRGTRQRKLIARPMVFIPLACLVLAACATGVYIGHQIWTMEKALDGSFVPATKDAAQVIREHQGQDYTGSYSDDATMSETDRADWFGLKVNFPDLVAGYSLHRYPGHQAALSYGVSLATTMENSPLDGKNLPLWNRMFKSLSDETEFRALAKDWDIYKSLFADYWDGDSHLVLFVIAKKHYREAIVSGGSKPVYLGVLGSLWGDYDDGQTGVYPGYAEGEKTIPDEKHKPHMRDFQQLFWDSGDYTYLLFGSEGTHLSADQAVAFAKAFMAAQLGSNN
jgi:hypothetical protein